MGVVRCERPGWDGEALVRTAGSGMVVVHASVLRLADERLVPDAELAARHDDADRLGWLGDRLRSGLARAGRTVQALLLPPLLGLERSRAAELSEHVGVACGEATGLPGGPVGLRFERARDRALAAAGVTVVAGRVAGVEASAAAPDRWTVRLEDRELDAGAVVLAAGGLIGGGLEYQPSESMLAAALPPTARPVFRCTIDAPVRVGAHGRPLGVPGSLFGVAPESLAWPLSRDALMDRVGVLCDDGGRAAPRPLRRRRARGGRPAHLAASARRRRPRRARGRTRHGQGAGGAPLITRPSTCQPTLSTASVPVSGSSGTLASLRS